MVPACSLAVVMAVCACSICVWIARKWMRVVLFHSAVLFLACSVKANSGCFLFACVLLCSHISTVSKHNSNIVKVHLQRGGEDEGKLMSAGAAGDIHIHDLRYLAADIPFKVTTAIMTQLGSTWMRML